MTKHFLTVEVVVLEAIVHNKPLRRNNKIEVFA